MNRKFDELGRIVLPKEMRNALGFDEEHNVATIVLENDKIVIKNMNRGKGQAKLIVFIKQAIEELKQNDKFSNSLILEGKLEVYEEILKELESGEYE